MELYDAEKFKQLAFEKEKEWKNILEMRATSAEQELNNVRQNYMELKAKMEKVKDDFTYNLSLLRDRDAELDKAERIIDSLRREASDYEKENSELRAKNDTMISEVNKLRKQHADNLDSLKTEYEKQKKRMLSDMNAQQTSMKLTKESLEENLRNVEETMAQSKRALENGFQDEIDRIRKASDLHLDEIRSKLALADTEARVLAKELEASKETERRRKIEVDSLNAALDAANEKIRQLEWTISDKSAMGLADLRQLQKRLEEVQAEAAAQQNFSEQKIAQLNRDLSEKVVELDKLQKCRFEDAGDTGKIIGELKGEISRLKTDLEKKNIKESDVRVEKEVLDAYRSKLEERDSKIISLTEANAKLESALQEVRSKPEKVSSESEVLEKQRKEALVMVEALNKQNSNLKEAVRQMTIEMEALVAAAPKNEGVQKSKPNTETKGSQTKETEDVLLKVGECDDIPANVEIPRDPRLKAFVENLVQRSTALQRKCSELVAEGRRQQIRAESAASQLESVEYESQRLRSTLEHTRYELSAERSRNDADKQSFKKQIADLEERLAEARVVADEFHAEANSTNAELAELRRRMASKELNQKTNQTGIGFGGQELYIQQLEDQIKEFATRAKPQDYHESANRLKRAIAIIVQLQKDRTRLLDLAARLRASNENLQNQLDNFQKILKDDNQVKRPTSASSNLSKLDRLETIAYENMREKLSRQMNNRDEQSFDNELAELSASFPNSEAWHELFQKIDDVAAQPDIITPKNKSKVPYSPSRVQGNTRPVPAVSAKGKTKPVARVWVSEHSPPAVRAARLSNTRTVKK